MKSKRWRKDRGYVKMYTNANNISSTIRNLVEILFNEHNSNHLFLPSVFLRKTVIK